MLFDLRTGHMMVLVLEVDEEDQPTGEYFDDTPDDFGRIAQVFGSKHLEQYQRVGGHR